MTWTQQRQRVDLLSDRAQAKRREARRVRSNLKGWMTSYLGSVETLAWLFAAGTFWAVGRSSAVESSATRRSIFAALNTSLLVWQLVNRRVKFARPVTGNRSQNQQ